MYLQPAATKSDFPSLGCALCNRLTQFNNGHQGDREAISFSRTTPTFLGTNDLELVWHHFASRVIVMTPIYSIPLPIWVNRSFRQQWPPVKQLCMLLLSLAPSRTVYKGRVHPTHTQWAMRHPIASSEHGVDHHPPKINQFTSCHLTRHVPFTRYR